MKLSSLQWFPWIVATFVAALTFCAFAYTNFETKDHAKETKEELKEMLTDIKSDVKEIKRMVR